MYINSKLEAALKGLFVKDSEGKIALRTAAFDDSNVSNAASSQSPRSLENLLLGAIGLDGDGKPVIRLVGAGRPYKVFSALITQSGTDTPVLAVLENTTGVDMTAARTGVGVYTLTASADAFTENKTAAVINLNAEEGKDAIYARTSATVITVNTDNTGVAADDVLAAGTFIEIRVYN